MAFQACVPLRFYWLDGVANHYSFTRLFFGTAKIFQHWRHSYCRAGGAESGAVSENRKQGGLSGWVPVQ